MHKWLRVQQVFQFYRAMWKIVPQRAQKTRSTYHWTVSP